jgi:hypothetical protein
MSESNGSIIKVGSRSLRKFQIGDGPVFQVDVIKVYDQWIEIDRRFRDAEGKVPPENRQQLRQAGWEFVSMLERMDLSEAEQAALRPIDGAQAEEFMSLLTREVLSLQDFFAGILPRRPSSPERTTVVTVSE